MFYMLDVLADTWDKDGQDVGSTIASATAAAASAAAIGNGSSDVSGRLSSDSVIQ